MSSSPPATLSFINFPKAQKAFFPLTQKCIYHRLQHIKKGLRGGGLPAGGCLTQELHSVPSLTATLQWHPAQPAHPQRAIAHLPQPASMSKQRVEQKLPQKLTDFFPVVGPSFNQDGADGTHRGHMQLSSPACGSDPIQQTYPSHPLSPNGQSSPPYSPTSASPVKSKPQRGTSTIRAHSGTL